MVLILLEALGALILLLLIVWWTMFSGRKHGEPPVRPVSDRPEPAPATAQPPSTPASPTDP